MVTSKRDPCSQLQGALNSREREITSLRRQLDTSQDELAALRRDKEITIRENRRLQDDLATMTRENQVCNKYTRHSSVLVFLCCIKEINNEEITAAPVVFLFMQAVHVEMEEALHEKDELKLRVHSYITEVSRIEKLMATKAGENLIPIAV